MAKNRLPAVYQLSENARAGGLMSYGASEPDLFRRAAGYVHRILQGTKPADLPVELATKFDRCWFLTQMQMIRCSCAVGPALIRPVDTRLMRKSCNLGETQCAVGWPIWPCARFCAVPARFRPSIYPASRSARLGAHSCDFDVLAALMSEIVAAMRKRRIAGICSIGLRSGEYGGR
jgi:hypothetical protein